MEFIDFIRNTKLLRIVAISSSCSTYAVLGNSVFDSRNKFIIYVSRKECRNCWKMLENVIFLSPFKTSSRNCGTISKFQYSLFSGFTSIQLSRWPNNVRYTWLACVCVCVWLCIPCYFPRKHIFFTCCHSNKHEFLVILSGLCRVFSTWIATKC